MPMSEAAMVGIRINGRFWKFRVPSIQFFSEQLDEAIVAGDADKANTALRGIGKTISIMIKKVPCEDFSPILEANDFFNEETLNYEFENMEFEFEKYHYFEWHEVK